MRCTGYDGSKVWAKLHDLPKEIDCESCADHADSLFSGLHDAVNLGLGKKPHNPKNFSKFAAEIECAYNRCKAEGFC
jgi:hypothetical protein